MATIRDIARMTGYSITTVSGLSTAIRMWKNKSVKPF